jgi:3'-5' exoribonuclease
LVKGMFVEEIDAERPVEGVFYIAAKKLANTRDGKPYLSLTLADRTGQIEAKIWDDAVSLDSKCKKDGFVAINAFCKPYNGALQLTVKAVRPVDEGDVNLADFMPAAQVDEDALWQEMSGYMGSISDPVLSGLLSGLFSDEALVNAYCTAPGAKRMHHAYLHGLLVHTLQMVRTAAALCKLYPVLNRDLLIAGVILHDLGKIVEYDFSRPGFSRTDEGKLVGHLNIAVSMIDEAAAKIGLDHHMPCIVALKHLILSHHGRYEYGSPVLPMTREAFVLHFIDEIDAKINYLDALKSELKGHEETWSGYQGIYGRAFHLP